MTDKKQADRIIAEAIDDIKIKDGEEVAEAFLNYIPSHYGDAEIAGMGVDGLLTEFDCMYIGRYHGNEHFAQCYLKERLAGSEVSIEFLKDFIDWEAVTKYLIKDVCGYAGEVVDGEVEYYYYFKD